MGRKGNSLAEIPLSVDIVNVYRRSEFLPDVTWCLSSGCQRFLGATRSESLEAEEVLRAGDHDDIVMNRCIRREHTRLILEQ